LSFPGFCLLFSAQSTSEVLQAKGCLSYLTKALHHTANSSENRTQLLIDRRV